MPKVTRKNFFEKSSKNVQNSRLQGQKNLRIMMLKTVVVMTTVFYCKK